MESATDSAAEKMHRPLWIKFTLLLLAVAFLALMSSFFLRAFIIGEFRHFREGETEDRVYWVSADLEGCYEKHGGPLGARLCCWRLRPADVIQRVVCFLQF